MSTALLKKLIVFASEKLKGKVELESAIVDGREVFGIRVDHLVILFPA